MRAVLIAVVIGLVRLGVGAQEECPNTQLLGAEAEINHGDLGLLLLQVSKAAATAATTASEIRGKLVAAPVSHRHKNAAESNAEKGQVAAPSSEQVGHHHDVHHAHTSPSQELQTKQKVSQLQKNTNSDAAQLQKNANSDEEAESKAQDKEKVAPITFGSCFSSEYGYVIFFLAFLLVVLTVVLIFQYKRNEKATAKIRGLRARLRADKYLLKADEKKLRAEKELLKEEQKRLILAVHDRGNIFFDPEQRRIVLKRSIPFEPVVRLEGLGVWQTLARYVDPQQALLILSDVAEVCQILPFACFLIEGHTLQGGTIDDIDEFAHEVADARAILVKETLMAFGVPRERLEALGLPGALGNNQAEVLLKLVN